MAKTNKIVEEGVQADYTSVIVSYSNGIDSTGALYWALQEFTREKIYEKGRMFEWGKKLHLEPHFCYEYLGRCSYMACMFMSDWHAVENMKRYPNQIQPFIQAEIRLAHTWKKGRSLGQLWDQCQDIDDVKQERLVS